MHTLTYAGLATIATCLSLSPLASAQSKKVWTKGLTQPVDVEVHLGAGNQYAHGDLQSARHDKDPNVFIGCNVDTHITDSGKEYGHGYCQAHDGHDYVICFTDSLQLMEGMRAINDTSYIHFTWVKDQAGSYVCNSISASTMSFYLR